MTHVSHPCASCPGPCAPVSHSLAQDPSQQGEWPPVGRPAEGAPFLRHPDKAEDGRPTAHACWPATVVEVRGRRKRVCQRQRAKVPALQGQARQAWEALRERGGWHSDGAPRSLPQGVQGEGAHSGDRQHTRRGGTQAKTTQETSRHRDKTTTPHDQLSFIGLYTRALCIRTGKLSLTTEREAREEPTGEDWGETMRRNVKDGS